MLIDSFDLVTRVNRLPDPDVAADLGTRTDIYFTRCGHAPSFVFRPDRPPSLLVHAHANASLQRTHTDACAREAAAPSVAHTSAKRTARLREIAADFCRKRAAEGAPNTWDCTAEGEFVALSCAA